MLGHGHKVPPTTNACRLHHVLPSSRAVNQQAGTGCWSPPRQPKRTCTEAAPHTFPENRTGDPRDGKEITRVTHKDAQGRGTRGHWALGAPRTPRGRSFRCRCSHEPSRGSAGHTQMRPPRSQKALRKRRWNFRPGCFRPRRLLRALGFPTQPGHIGKGAASGPQQLKVFKGASMPSQKQACASKLTSSQASATKAVDGSSRISILTAAKSSWSDSMSPFAWSLWAMVRFGALQPGTRNVAVPVPVTEFPTYTKSTV